MSSSSDKIRYYAKSVVPFLPINLKGGSLEEQYLPPTVKLCEIALETGPSSKLYMQKSIPIEIIRREIPSYKKLIEPVDFRRSIDNFFNYLSPVWEEIGTLKPRQLRKRDRHKPEIYNILDAVTWLGHLDVACKKQAQLISSPANVGVNIKQLKNTKEHLKSDESKARLSKVIGIISSYSWNIRTKKFVSRAGINIQDCLEDIWAWEEIEQASRCRKLIGIPGKAKIMKIKLEYWIKRALRRKETRDLLNSDNTILSLINTKSDIVQKLLSDVLFRKLENYIPPVVSSTLLVPRTQNIVYLWPPGAYSLLIKSPR